MTTPHPPLTQEQLRQIVRRLNPQHSLQRAWPLQGGVSALVMALEIRRPDASHYQCVVRQHGPADRAHNPHIAAHEYSLLAHLHRAGLPVPAPYLLDDSGQISPIPYLVLEFVDGAADFEPADAEGHLRQMAAALAHIHRADATPLGFLPHKAAALAGRISQAAHAPPHSDEGRIYQALSGSWPLKVNPQALLHGDYWPGNLLWRAGTLAAVIDWEDAALGDPLCDLANARLEVLWAFGRQAMQGFTGMYQGMMPRLNYAALPYWDLAAALRHTPIKPEEWGLDAATEATMRARMALFVAQALGRL